MKKNHVFPISSSTIFFHFCMMLASIYYVMLLTDWENPGLYTGNSDSRIGESKTAYNVKLVAEYLTIFVFIFSLVAPHICKSR